MLINATVALLIQPWWSTVESQLQVTGGYHAQLDHGRRTSHDHWVVVFVTTVAQLADLLPVGRKSYNTLILNSIMFRSPFALSYGWRCFSTSGEPSCRASTGGVVGCTLFKIMPSARRGCHAQHTGHQTPRTDQPGSGEKCWMVHPCGDSVSQFCDYGSICCWLLWSTQRASTIVSP